MACTTTETEVQVTVEYDAYDGGPVFPNLRPKLALPDGPVGLTSDNGSDTVTVLDLTTLTVIASAPIGRHPVDNDGPHHIAVDRARGFAYVALAYPPPVVLPGPHAAHGLSTRAGFVQKLSLDDLGVLGEVRVDQNPGDIVLSADGSRIVVSHFDIQKALSNPGDLDAQRATLAVVDADAVLAAGSPDPLRITTCVAPHGVSLSAPDGRFAYVACYGEDSIAVVDTTDPSAEIVRVPVGPGAGPPGAPIYGPYSAVASPDGGTLAVGSTESKDVRLFDIATQTMDAVVIATMGAPFFAGWSPDGAVLYVPTQQPDALLVVDVASGDVMTSRNFADGECELPHEVVLGPDPSTLFVVCEGDHLGPGAVLALDAATLETVSQMPVGVYPDKLAIAGAAR